MPFTVSDNVEIWWAVEGDGPAVLLIPGRGDGTDVFPDLFVAALRDGGLAPIRYDPRDTGLSSDGHQDDTLATMADDAIAVLDAAGVARAHVVALSMGGLLAADLATRYGDRVESLTFVSAMSPHPDAGMGDDFFTFEPDPVVAVINAMGDVDDADRSWARAEVDLAKERARPRPNAVMRHQEAAFRLGWVTLDDLTRIDEPTTVVHGSLDNTLPVAHATAIADAIPGARLEIRPGMGHLPRPADWAAIAGTVLGIADRSTVCTKPG